jgi:hypothetical protein
VALIPIESLNQETITEPEVSIRFTAPERQKIERLRELFKVADKTKWEIGDLVLEVAGPSGVKESYGRLAALSRELDKHPTELATYRITSEVFPPDHRKWDVPHYAYVQTQAYPAAAPTILSRVSENPRAYSDTALKETKAAVLKEMNILPKRPTPLTPAELFINRMLDFAEKVRKNQISVTTLESQQIRRVWKEAVEPLMNRQAR